MAFPRNTGEGHGLPDRLSPDGNVLAELTGRAGIVLSNATNGKFTRYLKPVGVTFSPDGRRLVTASEDSTALVWDLKR